ncbi:unnamed protein product [Leuciscus chuanchicus]
MASSGLRRCNSVEFLPPHIAAVVRLTNEFLELYARDHPQLQQCIQKLHNIIKTFEKDFRGSTEGSKDAGVKGIIGGASVLTGIGIVLAPFTLGASAVIAGVAVGGTGALTLTAAGIKSYRCRSEKKEQMKRLREDIEAELKEFQDKITPMAEKMKDLHEQTEKILEDFKKLEQDARDLSKIRLEDLAELTEQMSGNMHLITSIAEIYGGFSLVLDIISINENTRALRDMDKLAETPIDEEIDESEIRSKAGKFIAEIRKLMNQLQNIIDELEKTKHKLSEF